MRCCATWTSTSGPSRASDAIPDSRRVPARDGTCEIRERASHFLAFAFRADLEESARERVGRIEREFHDATHVCFAWRIGPSVRAADAGEPAGTAGKPILSAIDEVTLDFACVAVVRYFGGTKLGTAGLVRCYRSAARGALADAGVEEIFDVVEIAIDAAYEKIAAVKRLIDPPNVVLLEEAFTDRARFRVAVRRSRLRELARILEEERLSFEAG